MKVSILNKISFKVKLIMVPVLGLLIFAGFSAWSRIRDMRMEAERAIVEKSRALVLTVESVRQEMEKKWEMGLFSVEMVRVYAAEGSREKLLGAIPVVSAWESAMRKAKEGNYTFKVPKFKPRNPRNEPDAFEAEIIRKMKSENLNEFYKIDKKANTVRYFRPVRLSETCMLCHGDPANSKRLWGNKDGMDPTGSKMENWNVGDIHGSFEVISSLDEADEKVQKATISIILTTVLIIGTIILILVAVIQTVVRPVSEVSKAMAGIADGHLDVEIDPKTATQPDEIGLMAQKALVLIDRLSSVIGGVLSSSRQVASAADEIAKGNQDLASRTEQQAAALEETAASMEEMNASIKQNTSNASDADKKAVDTGEKADRGSQAVHDVMKAMRSINESSGKISDIITLMNEIAFQTNLLALNASIEAARAGEHGRGFAVVAVEVRKLAQRSDDASKKIQSLITESRHEVENGVEIVETAGQSLTEINDSVKEVASYISQIAQASAEQFSSAEEINKTVESLDENTQQNASLVEETSAASIELSSQAKELNESINFFKLKNDEGNEIKQLPGSEING